MRQELGAGLSPDAPLAMSAGVDPYAKLIDRAPDEYWSTVNAGTTYCIGFRPWRRHMVSAFLRSDRGELVFCPDLSSAKRQGLDRGARALIWANTETQELRDFCADRGIPLWRMEDGFLRSVGLGSEFVPPKSLVLDTRGIYYDANHASDLEHILQHAPFDSAMLKRATHLVGRIIESGVSKYNAEQKAPPEVRARCGQTVILIPGQVGDDASIARGSPDLRSNLELLEQVRDENPGAYLIYKMHPDVVFGRRKDGIPQRKLMRCADQVIAQARIDLCLSVADEVHTMTSLTGFEALLRGKSVVTYGLPFYAGWGLTRDRLTISRRSRALSMPELVAGALIAYPRYYDWTLRRFTSVEATLEMLALEKGGKSVPWYERNPLSRRLYARYRMFANALRYV